jgi:hypothetical protein
MDREEIGLYKEPAMLPEDPRSKAPLSNWRRYGSSRCWSGKASVRLRQPVLVANIVVGILVGRAAFGLVKSYGQFDLPAVPLNVKSPKLQARNLSGGQLAPRLSGMPL